MKAKIKGYEIECSVKEFRDLIAEENTKENTTLTQVKETEMQEIKPINPLKPIRPNRKPQNYWSRRPIKEELIQEAMTKFKESNKSMNNICKELGFSSNVMYRRFKNLTKNDSVKNLIIKRKSKKTLNNEETELCIKLLKEHKTLRQITDKINENRPPELRVSLSKIQH